MLRKVLLLAVVLSLLFYVTCGIWFDMIVLASPREAEYVGIAKYYDNRKCVVTVSLDDLVHNTSAWENCLSMLTRKRIYHTAAVITNYTVGVIPGLNRSTDWNYIQYWVNQGFTEVASHSRNHVHTPYDGRADKWIIINRGVWIPTVSYEWQINGSKNDIIGNLTLPAWWRYGEREYVYAWIEPYGSCDSTARRWLGECGYLCDRGFRPHAPPDYDFAAWDSANGLFSTVGYSVEMGTPRWGGESSPQSLNHKFEVAYDNGGIYHLLAHPTYVDWSEGGYADQHTDYISNRTDVWYVPLGLLYLYHWVDVRNVTHVSSTGSGQNKVFRISIDETDHENYGVSYPITYVFKIPSDWTTVYVYYRYRKTDPWILMENKSSEDFFNGVNASRFDLNDHKAYVSVGFSDISHEVYLQLRYTPLESTQVEESPTRFGWWAVGIVATVVVAATAIYLLKLKSQRSGMSLRLSGYDLPWNRMCKWNLQTLFEP
ncbi:hypothetical protein CP083_01260 [Candidatus Bathyarchaeota archaeon B24-2]|nr:MAG: hypothetical protein CP083_01260 [Candidatus Bathyarchaeota archaeon B24-2]